MAVLPLEDAVPGFSLADYLPFLLPEDGEELLPREARRRVEQLARGLVPVPRVAVECRLQAGANQVDLQQNLYRADYALLVGHADSLARRWPEDPKVAAFGEFARKLATPGSVLFDGIGQIYLEYDLVEGLVTLPSVFVSLPEDRLLAMEVTERTTRILLGQDAWNALAASTERCFTACGEGAYVSGLGLMLGRPTRAIRLNVKRLLPTTFADYLARAGYPGESARVAQHFSWVVGQADRVTVALDVGTSIYPRLGLECFFDEQPDVDLRWKFTLAELCTDGLCSQAKATAFLALPADTLPPTTAHPWPADLIRQSLLRSENEFSSFARRVFHLKVTSTEGRLVEAKAYFGAGHLWIKPAEALGHWKPLLGPAQTRQSCSLPGAEDVQPIVRAIAQGTAFLLERQLQSGFWHDFKAYGMSDEWVSAFIAAQLLETGFPQALGAAEECRACLEKTQRPSGGWGYCKDQAPDSDSTAWALRLLQKLGRGAGSAFVNGHAFLARHTMIDGSVATYADHLELAPRIRMSPQASFAGWEQPHVCVTAAAAPFLPETTLHYLRGAQHDSHWTGYWWVNDAYTTALAVEALQPFRELGDREKVAAAAAWAAGSIREAEASGPANAFDTAFWLRILATAGAGSFPEEQTLAIRMLLDQQIEGGWLPAARLRIPQPSALNPDGGTERVHLDYRANFTTAAVVGALALAQERSGPK